MLEPDVHIKNSGAKLHYFGKREPLVPFFQEYENQILRIIKLLVQYGVEPISAKISDGSDITLTPIETASHYELNNIVNYLINL